MLGARVEHVIGAERAHDVVLAPRSGGDDLRAVALGHGQCHLPRRSRRGLDQHGLTRDEPTQWFQSRQRGRPVHDQAQRLRGAPALRHRDRSGRRQDRVLGESAPEPTPIDLRPELSPAHTFAHRHDLTGSLESRHIGWRRAVPGTRHDSSKYRRS